MSRGMFARIDSGAGLPAIGLTFTPLPSPRRRARVRCSSVASGAATGFALVVPHSAVKKPQASFNLRRSGTEIALYVADNLWEQQWEGFNEPYESSP